ncbi:MAG: ATP phosphoribosyltransferase regulatory subunit [Halieaceae bacterium]|jgi:ATP phosphoribosyltransferase regulatory subunit
MTTVDRWLLPDGVEEVLPAQADKIEGLRRDLLTLYRGWGYELVIPPLMEFTDSLLIGLGSDVDMLTFKVIDQLSGRTLGIRADITPQVARIDAHSLRAEGVSRLCYAGSVLHTRPKSLLASRSPIQLGAELYGAPGLDADIEVIALMLQSLTSIGLVDITLDLGHIAVYRTLLAGSGLDDEQEAALFTALQQKAIDDLVTALEPVIDIEKRKLFVTLSGLHGDTSVLEDAANLLRDYPDAIAAVDELAKVGEAVCSQFPGVNLYYDLSELRGYHYHTGMVFAAYVPGCGQAIANGGRYDDVGAVFGRARPATGFNADLKKLADLAVAPTHDARGAIAAPVGKNEELVAATTALREQGEVVIASLDGVVDARCDRELIYRDGLWCVDTLAETHT